MLRRVHANGADFYNDHLSSSEEEVSEDESNGGGEGTEEDSGPSGKRPAKLTLEKLGTAPTVGAAEGTASPAV